MMPPTNELRRLLHEDRVAQLQGAMHRPPSFAARRALGAWMVAVGVRLAPEVRLHSRQRGVTKPEAAAPESAS